MEGKDRKKVREKRWVRIVIIGMERRKDAIIEKPVDANRLVASSVCQDTLAILAPTAASFFSIYS